MNGRWVRNRFGQVYHYINLDRPLSPGERIFWTLCNNWGPDESCPKAVRRCPRCERKLKRLMKQEVHGAPER